MAKISEDNLLRALRDQLYYQGYGLLGVSDGEPVSANSRDFLIGHARYLCNGSAQSVVIENEAFIALTVGKAIKMGASIL